MELLDMLKQRRSVRTYADTPIPQETLDTILKAGLFAPSGRNRCPWDFILVQNKATLEAMSRCRDAGSTMLSGAAAAIVVIGDPEKADTWTEDCSIAMAYMHLMADHLGIGSCWIQGRMRTVGKETTEEYLRRLLHFPDTYRLEAILSLGYPNPHPEARTEKDLPEEKVHVEQF